MFYSPLRYPGGKNRLAKFISQICINNNISNHYVEPYAGGASVALHLLFEKKIQKITINDYDRSIWAFWYCVLNHTNKFCQLIENTDITIENWIEQKKIQKNKKNSAVLELGFSTFFLNRTNMSGIINAGVIGGIHQNGKYKINCRFNKKVLIERINKIAKYKKQIKLYNIDALELIKKIQSELSNQVIFYLDPPYLLKGSSLYMNYYTENQHIKVSNAIKDIQNANWIISYDNTRKIRDIYKWVPIKRQKQYLLNHFAHRKKTGKEILFFSETLKFNIDLKNL